MLKRKLTIILALLLPFVAGARSSITVQAPNLVAVDEQFNLTFVIEGENAPNSFEWQCSDDFQLVWGPQKGTSTSISIINGKKNKSSQVTYTYVLRPRKAGTFTIPQAVATLKGETVTSDAQSIEVVSEDSSSARGNQSASSSSSRSSGEEESGNVSGDNLFLRLVVSKTKAVVGEPLTASLKIYQNVNLARFEDARFPSFGGFWNQEIQAPSNIEFQREKVGNRIYNTAVLRSWQLIPQQSGDLQIEPAELVCLVNVRAHSSSSGSFFDSFFQDDYRTVRKRVIAPAVTVKVLPLPSGAPASFGGGVGKFHMSAALNRDSLQVHDAASLKIEVAGKGNVALLEAPKVAFPADFEVYDVKVSDTAQGKIFEYPFIPRSYGDFDIGPVEYSFYDIKSGKYETLRSQMMHLKVSRGNAAESQPSAGGQLQQGVIRKDVRDLGSDVRFIATKVPSFSRKGDFFVWSVPFWIAASAILLLSLAFYFCSRKISSRRADVAGTRNRRATKMAVKRLAKAGEYLASNLYSAFYDELHKALLGFVSDKLGMDISEMSKDNIKAALAAKGVPEGLCNDFDGLLDACEYARYAPSGESDALRQHYESALGVISSIDESMKKKNTFAPGVAPVVVLLLAFSSPSIAAEVDYPDSLWNSAVAAYSDTKWDDAIKDWTAINSLGLESPELYCNIANAYFKAGDIAHSMLFYERALKLDPSYADARFNLELAGALVQDKIESVPEFFLTSALRQFSYSLRSDVWAILALVLFALALAALLLFLLSGSRVVRKSGFFSALVVLLLCVMCVCFSASQRSSYRDASEAIVTIPVVSVKSSPAAGDSKDLFVLHEGTKVQILDQVGKWCNIEIADGRQGWIGESAFERI